MPPIIRRSTLAVVVLVLFASGTALADDLIFLSRDKVDLSKLLAPQPDPQSDSQQRDLAAVLEVQRSRTPQLIDRAIVDCQNRKLVPNPAHPDQPVTKVK